MTHKTESRIIGALLVACFTALILMGVFVGVKPDPVMQPKIEQVASQ